MVGAYSSRGPTRIDYAAKPDLVAPGTGIVSLSAPESLFYTTQAAYLVKGNIRGLAKGYKPYLSLTGTSMAAPVVFEEILWDNLFEPVPAVTTSGGAV